MAGITSTTGLITGIPIQDTVDKLIAAASQPKDNLTARNTDLQSQQAATSQLSALVSAFQFEVNTIKTGGVFVFFKGTPDWITVRTRRNFIPLHVNENDVAILTRELEARTGARVVTVK